MRALSTLRAEGIGADLWIIGGPGREGTFQKTLRNLVRELELDGCIHFVDPVPGPVLAECMSVADVFCLASAREGWPNVVHEALGCGTPVVATDVGGVPDLMPSEEHGIVIPIGDQGKLVDGLRRACSEGGTGMPLPPGRDRAPGYRLHVRSSLPFRKSWRRGRGRRTHEGSGHRRRRSAHLASRKLL